MAGFFILLASQTPAADLKIAFASNRDGNYEIYVMDADGSNTIELTHNLLAIDDQADWSPDGTKIVFTSDQDGDFDIYVMNANGSRLVNLIQDHQKHPIKNSKHKRLVSGEAV